MITYIEKTEPMFATLFQMELQNLTAETSLAETFWKEIKKEYTHPNRYYHNLDHLNQVALALLPVRNEIIDWRTLVFFDSLPRLCIRPAAQR